MVSENESTEADATERRGDDADAPAPLATPPAKRRRLLPFAVLAVGGLTAAYLGSRAPREQHVKLLLGPHAEEVTALEIQYIAADDDVVRSARMAFEPGPAPRVVSHEPELADGDYRLRIDVDTRHHSRRSVERRVTLGGGSTQVDLATVVESPSPAASALPGP